MIAFNIDQISRIVVSVSNPFTKAVADLSKLVAFIIREAHGSFILIVYGGNSHFAIFVILFSLYHNVISVPILYDNKIALGIKALYNAIRN